MADIKRLMQILLVRASVICTSKLNGLRSTAGATLEWAVDLYEPTVARGLSRYEPG